MLAIEQAGASAPATDETPGAQRWPSLISATKVHVTGKLVVPSKADTSSAPSHPAKPKSGNDLSRVASATTDRSAVVHWAPRCRIEGLIEGVSPAGA